MVPSSTSSPSPPALSAQATSTAMNSVLPSSAENSAAKVVFEAIREAARVTPGANSGQLDFLKSLREALVDRMNEINSQLIQIDRVIKAISEPRNAAPEKRTRRDFDVVRERVMEWMQSRRHQKFVAADLVRQFPELNGVPVCIFLKPLVDGGMVQKDSSQGNRRTKYFVSGES